MIDNLLTVTEAKTSTRCNLTILFCLPASLPYPGKLQQVQVPIVSNGYCNEVYRSITDNQICAGQAEGGKGICAVSVQCASL